MVIIHIIAQVTALLKTLEFQESASSKGHFTLCNCLVLGHTKYNGVQRIYCQSIFRQTLSWQSSPGHGHDQAAGHR